MKSKLTALIAGSTGLVGSHLLDRLIKTDFYKKIYLVVRKKTGLDIPGVEELIVDFDNIEKELSDVTADHVFCCLGTTMKVAGSKEAFFKVDFTYPFKLAQVMKEKGAQKFLMVTALGANHKSTFFYNRVKGEVENAIMDLDYNSLVILRPSLLLGDRKEARFAEDMAKNAYKVIDILFLGPLKKYKGIQGASVADAMIYLAIRDRSGTIILDSAEIMEASKAFLQSHEK